MFIKALLKHRMTVLSAVRSELGTIKLAPVKLPDPIEEQLAASRCADIIAELDAKYPPMFDRDFGFEQSIIDQGGCPDHPMGCCDCN